MINAKHQRSVFAFFMALFMSGAMSLVISLINLQSFNLMQILSGWMHAWTVSFMLALPATFLITPMVVRLVLYLLNPNEDIH